jgi:hypothetical protein
MDEMRKYLTEIVKERGLNADLVSDEELKRFC